jgi:isopenicillin N synthase-like dioxygenase
VVSCTEFYNRSLENHVPHFFKTAGLLTLVNQDDDICALEVLVSSVTINTVTYIASSVFKRDKFGKSLVPMFQVRNLSGEWIQARPIPGTFVCDIGDMLEVSFYLPN